MTIKSIQTRLRQAQMKFAEINQSRKAAETAYEKLNKRFIEGNASLEDTQSAKAALTVWEDSSNNLAAEISELEQTIGRLTEEENFRKMLALIQKTANEAGEFFEDYMKATEKLDDILKAEAERALDALSKYRTKKFELRQLKTEASKSFEGFSGPDLSSEVFEDVKIVYSSRSELKFGNEIKTVFDKISDRKRWQNGLENREQ